MKVKYIMKMGAVVQTLTRVSISRNSRREMTEIFLSRSWEVNFHFSFSSRFSRIEGKFSLSPLDFQDLRKNSLSFGDQFLFLLSIFKILETNFSFSSRFSRFCLCATPSSVIKNFGLILTSCHWKIRIPFLKQYVWLTVWLLFHFSLSTLSQIRISILSFCSQDWRTAFEMSLSTLVNEYIHETRCHLN